MQKTVAAAEDRSSKWPADWKERVGWAQAEADGRCLGGCRASAAGELNRRLLMLIVFAWGAGWQSHSQSLPTINCSIPLNHLRDLPDSTRPLSTDPKSINQFLFKVSSFLNYFSIILLNWCLFQWDGNTSKGRWITNECLNDYLPNLFTSCTPTHLHFTDKNH